MSPGLSKGTLFIITSSHREPYNKVLSGAHAKMELSYQFGEGGINKLFILTENKMKS